MSEAQRQAVSPDAETDATGERHAEVAHMHPQEEHPQQAEMPFAIVQGAPVTQIPQDLYIPPDALEVFLEAF